ncbi:GGDEF domain-containing protein [Acinetobacter sp. ANC 3813]|uniref:GGDEF domain-containing protein n=1 Tax=Acinetobacter sp. ANC 3813 TaxID=1977873 RepID=UPI000A348319|nr:GGDEF domain-containing protein [Acinetobacter sp. ANC 3813]OTG90368.1 hypothetical protein B9T34_07605 [Acinetobacter sp. ANC 3813]
MKNNLRKLWQQLRFHIFETDDVIIYWPDFYKGIMLLLFALAIMSGHLLWYVTTYHSDNRIWLNDNYYDLRLLTSYAQIVLTFCVLLIAYIFHNYEKFRLFMGWFIPLYFGLQLIFSAHYVGIYSPAAMAGIINILLIGFVLYQPKVIYSIMVIVAVVVVAICYLTKIDIIPYAPLFSDALDHSAFYKNTFWINSMVVLYTPILFVSAVFFEVLLSQWRRREKKIEVLSQIDGLTNVYNRRYVNDHLQKIYHKQHSAYALVILDLDHFKQINDSYGHEAGDEVLRQVGAILHAAVRGNDVVGRLGGEEFALVLSGCNLDGALEIAERCRSKIAQMDIHLNDGQVLKISASFGVAIEQEGAAPEEITRMADQALYLAKQQGRNQVRHFQELNLASSA